MVKNMRNWVKVVLVIVTAIIMLTGVLTVNTFNFKSRQPAVSGKVSYPVDNALLLKNLSGALQIPTVSNAGPVDYAQFIKYRTYLEKTFPLVHSKLERTINNNYNLIYFWKGSDPDKKPILVMSHYDVFTVTDIDWKYPAFSGTIADGYIWGRGALDNKSSGIGYLEAAEYLIKSGFKPTRSIYMVFGQDEENGGRQGAKMEAEYFKSLGVKFECMLDEGSFTVPNVLPGLPKTQWLALVAVAEKGFLNLKLSTEVTEPGHSSMPPPQTSVGILAAAIDKLEKNPFPARFSDGTRALFDHAGPETSFPFKTIFANQWLFGSVLESQFAKNTKSNALIRTTTAPTVFNAGGQPAAMPKRASAVINFRLLPGDTIKYVTDRVTAVINDPRIKVEAVTDNEGVWETPAVSSPDSDSFRLLQKTAREVMPDVIVSPYMSTNGSDGRYFMAAGLTENWFRFIPTKVPMEDLSGMHSSNEKLLTASYIDSVNFYIRLIQNFSQENNSAHEMEAHGTHKP